MPTSTSTISEATMAPSVQALDAGASDDWQNNTAAESKSFDIAYQFPGNGDDSLRVAARLNASQISPEEHKMLLAERHDLLQKKLAGHFTRRQANRLEYVRWSLDRIDDGQNGAALDAIESAVARYKAAFNHLQQLRGSLAEELQNVQKQHREQDRRKRSWKA